MRRVSSQRTTSASRSSRSTRSVTSSRLPIGVAQTASGIESASNATSPAPVRGRPSSRARHARPADVSPAASSALARRHERAGAEPLEARAAEAAADDDELRLEDVAQRRDARAELVADLGERLARLLVALRSRADEPVRVGGRPEQLPGDLVGRRPGDVRLEVAAPVQTPGTAARRRRSRCDRARPSRGRACRRGQRRRRCRCRASA